MIDKETYKDLLERREWFDCREKIVRRDRLACLHCKAAAGDYKKIPLTPGELEEREAMVLKGAREALDRNRELNDLLGADFDEEKEYRKAYNQHNNLHPKYNTVKVILQVHHTYYVYGNMPWEYPPESLKTLCKECHKEVHMKTFIQVFKDNTLDELAGHRNNCGRCHGTGRLPEYRHVSNGVCFACGGTGGDTILD